MYTKYKIKITINSIPKIFLYVYIKEITMQGFIFIEKANTCMSLIRSVKQGL